MFKRNVQKGLLARTKIIQSLEAGRRKLPEICRESKLTYDCVRYHLKSLIKEDIVNRTTYNKPFIWSLTGKGQQKLF